MHIFPRYRKWMCSRHPRGAIERPTVMKMAILKLATSALVIGLSTIACKPAGQTRIASASSRAPDAAQDAQRQAARARQALAAGRADRAIIAAEIAVALSPRDADYRALLGRSYLAAGRFASAETSFNDSVTIDGGVARVALSLALTQIAAGKPEAARRTLAAAPGVAAPDKGLALALAGDRAGGIATLEDMVRNAAPNAKTRQNLALAYALDGRWDRAMRVAAVDVPKGKLTERMMLWSKLTSNPVPAERIAALLRVTAGTDGGQPVALALAPATAAPVQLATIAPPAPLPVIAPAAPVPMMVQVETMTEAARPAAPILLARAAEPVAAMTVQTPPLLRKAVTVRPSPAASRGSFVVQLGAFSSEARVETAWSRISAGLSGYTPSSSTYLSKKGTVHRLALTGFTSRAAAVGACERVRASGGSCFVRAAAGDTPVRWAQAGMRLWSG